MERPKTNEEGNITEEKLTCEGYQTPVEKIAPGGAYRGPRSGALPLRELGIPPNKSSQQSTYSEQEIISYFKNLIRVRAKEFSKAEAPSTRIIASYVTRHSPSKRGQEGKLSVNIINPFSKALGRVNRHSTGIELEGRK
ncbi:hypothetical protein WN944_018993 [Citrus x changshan-huyou]|uniref:Uncharacterized protein n=1 Tax=Citrus x changshan-huyou TaxID=2935761 RepID=A0AAP0QEQ2_9ROSI